MLAIHGTTGSRVLSQDSSNLFICGPWLSTVRTNPQYLILDAFSLLRASMLLEICCGRLFQLFLYSFFLYTLSFIRYSFRFYCCLLGHIPFDIFSYAGGNLRLSL